MKQEFNWRDYDDYNEWLHSVLETLTENIEEKDKEIERLNNIIKELEKWLDDEKEATIFDYHFAIEDVLNKLQELKGSESNGQ